MSSSHRRPQALDVEGLLEAEAAAAVAHVVAERRRVEHHPPIRREPEPRADLGAARIAVGAREHVVARVARLEHLALDRIRAPEDRRREAVGGEDVLPVDHVAVPVALEAADRVAQVRDVEAELLERRAVPGLQAELIRAALEPVGEVVVGHDEAGARHRLVVLTAVRAQHRRGVGDAAHAVRDHPEVVERQLAADELLVDRARVVGVLPPAEARVDDGVAQRRLAAGGIRGVAQPALLAHARARRGRGRAATNRIASPSGAMPSRNGLWSTTVSTGSSS